MKTKKFLLLFFMNSYISAQSFIPVEPFDISKFLGTWYEIARLPHRFEKDLVGVTATYSKSKKEGHIDVLNQGYKKILQGKKSSARGKAKFATQNRVKGHLKVSFFGPFYADYIILSIDNSYTYALICSNSFNYLWILCRSKSLDPQITQSLIAQAKQLGFSTEKLIYVEQ